MFAVCLHSSRNLSLARQGVRYLILPASDFSSVLQASTTTSDVFKGAPLSTITPSLRGEVLADVAQCVDDEVNAQLPGNRCNGSRHCRKHMEYDWLRDGLRVECKSAKLSWESSSRNWYFRFSNIKTAYREVRKAAAFDELLLVLYTPTRLYFYKHDGKWRLTSTGRSTSRIGHQLWIRGGRNIDDWHLALNNIFGKLDDGSSPCSRFSEMSLLDSRIQRALDLRCDVTQRIFRDCPLSQVTPAARGKRLELLVRCVDQIVNPHAEVKVPDLGHCTDGLRRRGVNQALCDWHRGETRVECKSSQFQWDKVKRRWFFRFQNVKIARPPCFDELFLAFYTPRGVYVYRHDLLFGLSSAGFGTDVAGHHICVTGPRNEADWTGALNAILRNIGESGCDCLAFVCW